MPTAPISASPVRASAFISMTNDGPLPSKKPSLDAASTRKYRDEAAELRCASVSQDPGASAVAAAAAKPVPNHTANASPPSQTPIFFMTLPPSSPSSNNLPIAVDGDLPLDLLLYLAVVLEPLCQGFRRIHPLNSIEQGPGGCKRIGVHPAAAWIVDDLHGPGVQVLVDVDADVVVREKRIPQGVDVVAISGKESPARQQCAIPARVVLERCRIVLLRFQRDTHQKQVLPHAVRERLVMQIDHALGRHGAEGRAARVHHHHHDLLALDEVLVEPHLLVVLSAKQRVRDQVCHAASARLAYRGRHLPEACEQFAAFH